MVLILSNCDVTNYTWDFNDMLTQVTSGGNTYVYRYDGLGDRVARIENSAEKRYVGGLAETDSSGNITAYYIYGLGLISKITPSNQSYFYHFDGIASAIGISDLSGNMVNKYAYDAFGKVVNQQEAISNPFKYVGQSGVMDEGNGLFYMSARYYDPEVGRFINKDPIGFLGGDLNLYAYVDSVGKPPFDTNLYTYTSNNPINRIDPFGLRWYESPVFWMDVFALIADLSVPLTGPVGYVAGAAASFSATTLTINAYRKGKATRLDVVVSGGTTVLGLIPMFSLPADFVILYYDYQRAESDAPCKKK